LDKGKTVLDSSTGPEKKPENKAGPSKNEKIKTIAPGTAPLPRWCPPGLTASQRRRIQRVRADKLKEEAAEKARDEHFNATRPMIPAKKEWRMKETPAPSTSAPTPPTSTIDEPTLSDDEVDLLDYVDSPVHMDTGITP